uniref:CCHC-type domain-containing protein n=1 Tax=Anolis carolinensis TaxID=28377 RepID=A0A803T2C0_ANOCA
MEGLSFQLPRKSGVELSGVSSLQSSTESSSEEERKEKDGGQEDPEKQRSFLQEPETMDNGTRHASEVDGGAGEINVSKKSGLDGLPEKGERDRRRGGEFHGEATPGSSKPQQQKRGGRTYANVAGRGGGNPSQRPYGFPNLIEEEEYLDLFFGQASEVRNPRLRYVVRFRYLGSDQERGSRSYLSKKLLKDALEASREDVLAIIQLPGSKEIDVCLASEKVYRDFWMNCKTVKNVMPDLLAEYELIPLFRGDTKVLTISFRTTTIPAQDVARWVSKYAVILSGPDKKEDEQGYWTGEYRCVVSFKNEDPEYRHGKLPKYFFLGADRGITRYAGQPQACFQCGSYDHQRRLCTSSLCSRCGIRGHHTATCHSSIRCNFCGDLGHTYFWYPSIVGNGAAGHCDPAGNSPGKRAATLPGAKAVDKRTVLLVLRRGTSGRGGSFDQG